MEQINLFDFTHIHKPSNTKCRIKKNYGTISTCFVDPYPICIVWGKEEYSNAIICKNEDLISIENGIRNI